jgi:tetratricopeptide (TPR) repeat protein
MKLGNWKLWTAAIPLAAGLGVFLLLGGLNSFHTRPTPAASVKAVDTNAPAPQDPTHEKAALEEELKKKPGHPPILLRLAELARDAGQPKQAAEYLKQAAAADPKNVDASVELSRTLYEANDVDGALKETKRLLTEHPNQVDALYNLGAIYANLGKPELARQYWAQAVSTDPASDSGRKSADALTKIGK